MANVATMGPPPSPKEPRRSGRRSVPSTSMSKSPAGSPSSESAPKSKDAPQRPSLPATNGSSRNKRAKQEEHDDAVQDPHKTGTNGRTKRKAKDKGPLLVEIHVDDDSKTPVNGDDATAEPQDEEEEAGITRCICRGSGVEDAEFQVMCEMCNTWQHGQCMGYASVTRIPDHYYCEECRPDLFPELLKKYAKRARQSSANSHHTATGGANASRSSRSHSPAVHMKQQTKRRNTMNSRDAAYDESVEELMRATAAEAEAAAVNDAGPSSAPTETGGGNNTGDDGGEDADSGGKAVILANGHIEAPEPEAEVTPPVRRKRKRLDDDAKSTKRTRSASHTSDNPNTTAVRDPTPTNSTVKATPAPASTAKPTNSRRNRNGARKAQVQEQQGEGEEVASTSRRPTNGSRARANATHEHGTRRNQPNSNAQNSNAHATAASARAYHNSHAYAVSQQPLFTSWNLPDYLAHLEHMLPSDTPQPLEVCSAGMGLQSLERSTERGVRVKWPSKRMSVGDMNKRVRALVEWVGREQANALERGRRKEALQKALVERQTSGGGSGQDPSGSEDVAMVLEDDTVSKSPVQEKNLPGGTISAGSLGVDSEPQTMKLMEELMEELISFQERFGPGAKTKERDRRTVTS